MCVHALVLKAPRQVSGSDCENWILFWLSKVLNYLTFSFILPMWQKFWLLPEPLHVLNMVFMYICCYCIFKLTVLQVHVIRAEGDLTVKMKLRSLKIKDELQGHLSTNPQYLACSVLKNDKPLASPCTLDPQGRETSLVSHDDDDMFKDALPDFFSLSDSGIYSPKVDMSHSGNIGDSSEFESAGILIYEQDLLQGKSISSEIFYEAQGGDNLDFVSVIFSTRSSSSPDYSGIDTQVPNLSIMIFKLYFLSNTEIVILIYTFVIFR